MVFDHERDHPSRWATVVSIAEKIGCVPQTLHEWVKKAEVHSSKRAGVPTDVAAEMKALERENRELRQANEILRKASAYFAQAELDRPHRNGCGSVTQTNRPPANPAWFKPQHLRWPALLLPRPACHDVGIAGLDGFRDHADTPLLALVHLTWMPVPARHAGAAGMVSYIESMGFCVFDFAVQQHWPEVVWL